MEFKCKDCNGIIFFDPLVSGSEGNKPVLSYCICVDRDNDFEKFGRIKMTRKIIHKVEYAYYSEHLNKKEDEVKHARIKLLSS